VTSYSTGATGYIGGDILHALYKAHPEYEFSALVRNSEKGAPVAAAFPKIRLVYGGLDDSEVLVEEAARADIVVRKVSLSLLEGITDLDCLQILRMLRTTKVPLKQSARELRKAIPRRSLGSGYTSQEQVS